MVVSVPQIIRCLSLSETTLNTDAVGAPDKRTARELIPVPSFGSQLKVDPFLIVAISNSP